MGTLHCALALSMNIKSTSFWILQTRLKHGAKQPKDLVSLIIKHIPPTSKFLLNLSAYFLENKEKGLV
jgi:hypothetical protein